MSVTRQECEVEAQAAVAQWAAVLGVAGGWRVSFAFGRAGSEGGSLEANTWACVEMRVHRRTAHVLFDVRLPRDAYQREACHEVLHVLFSPLGRGIDESAEPAQTLMDDALHAAIDRLATVLTAAPPRAHDDALPAHAPWETESP